MLHHVKKFKKHSRQLEQELTRLGANDTSSQQPVVAPATAEECEPVKSFLDYIDEEIDATYVHHQSLNPDRDIVLDIAPESPIERQATALRHAFFIAEKEARYAGEEDHSSWDVLVTKYQHIIQFYESALSGQQLAADSENTSSIEMTVDNPDMLITKLQQDLLNLQTQYIELEERYLEVKEP